MQHPCVWVVAVPPPLTALPAALRRGPAYNATSGAYAFLPLFMWTAYHRTTPGRTSSVGEVFALTRPSGHCLCAGIPGLNPCINQDVTVGNETYNYYEFLVRDQGGLAARGPAAVAAAASRVAAPLRLLWERRRQPRLCAPGRQLASAASRLRARGACTLRRTQCPLTR